MIQLGNGQIALGDCLDVMRSVPSASVDMILCDLPYGTTQNKWDSVIPFEPLWSEYWRICRGPVVLTAAQPFTSALVMSCPDRFKYCWVWKKSQAVGHLNAWKQPMRNTEDIAVFYKNQCIYNPELIDKKPENIRPQTKRTKTSDNYGNHGLDVFKCPANKSMPATIIEFNNEQGTIHPTQKPVALFEYLIRTYTNEGDTVMDNCLGSGTTAIAAENTGRRWIGIERDPTYFGLACDRIARAVNA